MTNGFREVDNTIGIASSLNAAEELQSSLVDMRLVGIQTRQELSNETCSLRDALTSGV